MHQVEYIIKDIYNSLKYIKINGRIFIDDILPFNEREQKKIPELAIAGRKPQLMLMNGSTTLPKAELISIPNANPIITEMPETNELPMAIPLLTNEP